MLNKKISTAWYDTNFGYASFYRYNSYVLQGTKPINVFYFFQLLHEETLKLYENENRRDVESAEQVLFTTFTPELAKKIKITPKYADERSEKINNDLWSLIKYYFDLYNEKNDDCKFVVNEEDRTVKATDYSELPFLFYYWSGGQNKRYKALTVLQKQM